MVGAEHENKAACENQDGGTIEAAHSLRAIWRTKIMTNTAKNVMIVTPCCHASVGILDAVEPDDYRVREVTCPSCSKRYAYEYVQRSVVEKWTELKSKGSAKC